MRMLAIMLMTTIGLVGLGAKSGAQTGAAVSRAETRLITLGTAGGPFPRGKRAQSSNLLIVNGTPYLIDAGDGVARRLAKLEFNLTAVKAGCEIASVGVDIFDEPDVARRGTRAIVSAVPRDNRPTPSRCRNSSAPRPARAPAFAPLDVPTLRRCCRRR